MLRLTKKVDYGLMAISHIANSGERVSAKEIAEEYNIPAELLAKILQRLAREGLIESQNGPKGGYLLARDAGEITVSQVIQALEGPIGLLECYSQGRPPCELEAQCTIRTPMYQIQQAVLEALDRMTLEDVSKAMGRREPSPSLVKPEGQKPLSLASSQKEN